MLHRRAFVGGAGALGAAMLGTLRVSVGQGAVGTRRSMRGMSANDPDLAAYRRAVAAMKALPASDPRNWNRFAAVHASFCPHGNWYFLPWHRAYLNALENIVRDLADKPDFALPYWDWTAERQLPPVFAAGNPRNNPLNHPRPEFEVDETLPDDMVGPQVISRILASPDFEAFGSARPRGQNSAAPAWQRRAGARTELEFNPHDGVHGSLGGDMGQVGPASRDPIFYLHHANVDRLWAVWNARGNANSPEPFWRNFAFNWNFINADGSPWNVTVNGLQSPAALGYRYDDEEGRSPRTSTFSASRLTRSTRWAARCRSTGGLPATRCSPRPGCNAMGWRPAAASWPRRPRTTGRRRMSAPSAFRFRSAGRSPRSSSPGRWRQLPRRTAAATGNASGRCCATALRRLTRALGCACS